MQYPLVLSETRALGSTNTTGEESSAALAYAQNSGYGKLGYEIDHSELGNAKVITGNRLEAFKDATVRLRGEESFQPTNLKPYAFAFSLRKSAVLRNLGENLLKSGTYNSALAYFYAIETFRSLRFYGGPQYEAFANQKKAHYDNMFGVDGSRFNQAVTQLVGKVAAFVVDQIDRGIKATLPIGIPGSVKTKLVGRMTSLLMGPLRPSVELGDFATDILEEIFLSAVQSVFSYNSAKSVIPGLENMVSKSDFDALIKSSFDSVLKSIYDKLEDEFYEIIGKTFPSKAIIKALAEVWRTPPFKDKVNEATVFNAAFPEKIKTFNNRNFLKGDMGDIPYEYTGMGMTIDAPKPFVYNRQTGMPDWNASEALILGAAAFASTPNIDALMTGIDKESVERLKVLIGNETFTRVQRFSPFVRNSNGQLDCRVFFEGADLFVDVSGVEPLFVTYLKASVGDEATFVEAAKAHYRSASLLSPPRTVQNYKAMSDEEQKRLNNEYTKKRLEAVAAFPALLSTVDFTILDQLIPYMICAEYASPDQQGCGGFQTAPGTVLGDLHKYVDEIFVSAGILEKQALTAARNRKILLWLGGAAAVGLGVYGYRRYKANQ